MKTEKHFPSHSVMSDEKLKESFDKCPRNIQRYIMMLEQALRKQVEENNKPTL